MVGSLYLSNMRLLLAGAAAYSMSTLFSAMKPVLLTRIVEQNGWSDALAGLTVAMPFVGIAASALFVAMLTKRWALRTLGLAFGVVLITAEIASVVVFDTVALLLPLQLIGGVSVGVLMGAASGVIARRETPGPLFGAVDMAGVLVMSSMIALIGAAVQRAGLAGGYGAAALIAMVLVALMLPYREHATQQEHAKASTPLDINTRAIAVIVMAMLFVTCSGLGFTYMFTVAQSLGMTYAEAGRGIGVLLLVSAGACLVGGWASARFGPYRPLAFAYIVCAVGWYGVVHASNPTVFYASLVPAVFALQFNFPVLLDLAGSLDSEGRWGAINAPLQTSGFAWAAIAAGFIAGTFGVQALATATGIGMAVCLLLLLPARGRARIIS